MALEKRLEGGEETGSVGICRKSISGRWNSKAKALRQDERPCWLVPGTARRSVRLGQRALQDGGGWGPRDDGDSLWEAGAIAKNLAFSNRRSIMI